MAFERIVNVPKRGIGAAAVGKFYTHARENNLSLYQAACEMAKAGMLRGTLAKSVEEFSEFIESLRNRKDLRPTDLAKIIINDTGYLATLQQEQTTESRARIENLKELITALEDFPDIATFMEHVSLVVDAPKNIDEKVVTIMTLHSAKGLEFDSVFLAGWEEGLFPHSLSLQEGNLEEERRLAYVGITRARKRAFITYAQSRRVHNQWQNNSPSRFLSEISKEHIESGNF